MKNHKGYAAKRRRRRGSLFGVYRRSVVMISLGLLLFAATVGILSIPLRAKNRQYRRQENELTEKINEQNERAEKVEEFRQYVKTDEYKKKTAEEKLDLVDPDEIIFKASDG